MHRKIIAAITLTLLLFASSAAGEKLPFIGIVNKDDINIRSDSTVSSEILGRAKKGQEVTVIGRAYGWYKIRVHPETLVDSPPRNEFAWIHKKFVDLKPEVKPEVTQKSAQDKAVETGRPLLALPTNQPQPQTAVSAAEITLTGILKPYGKVLGRRGTHKLITEDKGIFLLKGDKKELNTFNSRRVRVSGIEEKRRPQEPYPLIKIKTIGEID